MSATNPLRIVLLDAKTAGTSVPVDVRAYTHLTAYVKGTGTTSSGTVVIETADYDPKAEPVYSGTWSELTTVNASDVSGGAVKAVSFTARAYCMVRHRIGTSIGGGGTVSTTLVAV